MYERILVVEDCLPFAALLKRKLETALPYTVDTATTLRETKRILEKDMASPLAAVLDIHLPDAPDGEVVDYVTGRDIPSLVLTADIDDDIRENLYNKNIIDYFLKEDRGELDLLVQSIQRLRTNSERKIMVVGDDENQRKIIDLLSRQHYRVKGVSDGDAAWRLADRESDFWLVISQKGVPGMDGLELTHKLRGKYGKDSLAIIGLTDTMNDNLTAKFIKAGANDVLKKPFGVEEFYCRIAQNLEMVGLFREIKDASHTDYLTKIFNRRYFFDQGKRFYRRARRENSTIALAMIDLDHFKHINDLHGHDVGDFALRKVADILRRSFRPTDIVARYGGEEFCVLMLDISSQNAILKLERVRKRIERKVIRYGNQSFNITVSVGLVFSFGRSLDEMIKQADLRLYQAKANGRNQVVAA